MVPDTSGVVSGWIGGVARAGVEQAGAAADPSYVPPDTGIDESALQPRNFKALVSGEAVNRKANDAAARDPARRHYPPGNAFSGTGFGSTPSQDGMTDAERNNAPFHQAY